MSAIISTIIHNQKNMNTRRYAKGVRIEMPQSTEELLAEIQRLRTEIQQLREMVNALFNAVFEEYDEEWDSLPRREDFNAYN